MPNIAEQWRTIEDLDRWLRWPMAMLSLAWLFVVIADLLWAESALLATLSLAIWLIFLLEFSVRFLLAPRKTTFLTRNWLTVLALVVPALRLLKGLRLFRAVRALRGLRLVRIVGTANRSMNALRLTLRRRRFGYVAGLTVLVILLGAAGMLSFEPASEIDGGFASYAHALWWTAMLVSSIGSEFWPTTTEGRVLSLMLSVYGLAVFGYITASFASFFVGRDAAEPEAPVAGSADIQRLAEEIRALREQLAGRK